MIRPVEGESFPFLRSLLFFISCLLLAGSPTRAEFCERTPRVLMLGDSWAHVMWLAQSLRTAFDEAGLGGIVEQGDVTAIGGSRADQWKKADKLALITHELARYPAIDTVHISLGGNDFFSKWKATQSDAEQEQVFTSIAADLEVLIGHILFQRSDLSVFLCGYTYLNFEETRAAGVVPWCASSGEGSIWARMGSPSSLALNQALARLEQYKARLADQNPRVTHLNNLGLMQYQYGYPSRGIAPKSVPLPDGDPNLPSPPEALNNSLDCAHLSPEGYLVLARHCVNNFYAQRYHPKGTQLVLYPQATGGRTQPSATGEGSFPATQLVLGDTEKNVLTSVRIPFEVPSLPEDAALTGVRLFLTRKCLYGSNPFLREPPALGQPVCQMEVFQEDPHQPGSMSQATSSRLPDAGIFAGSVSEDNWRVRIDLKPEALSCLRGGMKVQLQLVFQKSTLNSMADSIEFYPPTAALEEYRPVIEVFYSKGGAMGVEAGSTPD